MAGSVQRIDFLATERVDKEMAAAESMGAEEPAVVVGQLEHLVREGMLPRLLDLSEHLAADRGLIATRMPETARTAGRGRGPGEALDGVLGRGRGPIDDDDIDGFVKALAHIHF